MICLLFHVRQHGSTFLDGRTLATLFTHLERAAAEARLVRRMGYGAHEASCGAGFFGCARCIRQLADVDTRHGIENYRCSETKPEAEELQRFKPSVEAVFILAIPLQSYTMHGMWKPRMEGESKWIKNHLKTVWHQKAKADAPSSEPRQPVRQVRWLGKRKVEGRLLTMTTRCKLGFTDLERHSIIRQR